MSFNQKQESETSLQKIRFFPNSYWVKKDEKRSHKKMAAPCKRWGHGAVLYENHMYLFGGSGNNSNQRSWEAIYIMNCETFDWERVCPSDPFKGNIPESRDSHSSTRIGNNMYIFGGSNGSTPVNDMFAFNFTFRSWNRINATGDIPLPREGHSAAPLNDRYIFIYGGWNGKSIYNNHYLFDTMTNIWRKVENEEPSQEPAARESHTCSLVKDSFYVFGGQGHNLKKKENYFNDFFRAKLIFQKNLEKITCKWEKIVAKNNTAPPPRTSHSSTVYKDRYIFIIGGEGYCMDARDPKFGDEKKDLNSEKDFEDDKIPPCFPKNDVWIFDTDVQLWSLLEAKNSELLLPRFTHSCCVFKDQFIIFGGLKDYKNAVDDLIVLILDDEDYKAEKNKKDIDLCNQCRRLFMVESENKTKEKKFAVTNDDLSLQGSYQKESIEASQNISSQYEKLLSVQKKPKQADITGNFSQDYAQTISLDSLRKISQMIQWPFAAIGLLIDNAKIKKASTLRITAGTSKSQNKRFLAFTDDGEIWTLKEIYDVFLNMKLDISHTIDYEQKDQEERDKSAHEIAKSRYAANLKMGATRLGDTFVYGSKTETSIIIGIFSVVKEEVLFASWGINNDEKRRKIIEVLRDYFSESEFSELIGKNTVLILDLKKNRRLGNEEDIFLDELSFSQKEGDVFFKPHKVLHPRKKLGFPYKTLVDFSLKAYVKYFLLSPQTSPLKVFLNGEELPYQVYAETLRSNKELTMVELDSEIQDCVKYCKVYVETASLLNPPNPSDPDKKEGLPGFIAPIERIEPEEEKAEESKTNANEDSMGEANKPTPAKQGMLMYAEGRLTGRMECEMGDFSYFEGKWNKHKNTSIFEFFGVFEIKEFLKMNMLRTVRF